VKTNVKLRVINGKNFKTMKMRNKNLVENNLLEYLFFVYITLFTTVLAETWLRRNILVTHVKELSITIGNICAEYMNHTEAKKQREG
jgi:hypothetical protein